MVNVYEDDYKDEVVARVNYNSILDYWDGRNFTNGGVGRHLGITKLKDGSYVLIYGSQWDGDDDYGIIVDKDEALQAILKSGKHKLLESKKFSELRDLANETLIYEEDDE